MSRQIITLRSAIATAVAMLTLAIPGHGQAVAGTDASIDEGEFDEFDEYAQPRISDPLEPVNRSIFKFNDTLYRHVLRPVSRTYETVVPGLARRGITSFFDNLRFPVRFVSCVLQGKADRAGAETAKFMVNSTAGLAGFIKVSEHVPELRVPEEDIGQALGRWGVPHGPYLVWPVLGPSSLRDTSGLVADLWLDPVNWKFVDDLDVEIRWGAQTFNILNSLPERLQVYDAQRRAALDPYIAVRNGYMQYRDAAVGK